MEREATRFDDSIRDNTHILMTGRPTEEVAQMMLDLLNLTVRSIGAAYLPADKAMSALADKWGEQLAMRAFATPHDDPRIAYRMNRRADRQMAKRQKSA